MHGLYIVMDVKPNQLSCLNVTSSKLTTLCTQKYHTDIWLLSLKECMLVANYFMSYLKETVHPIIRHVYCNT